MCFSTGRPTLRLEDGGDVTYQADVDGAMTFYGETGALVSCDVEGTSVITDGELKGTMTEQLSSQGDLNCTSSGSYHLWVEDAW